MLKCYNFICAESQTLTSLLINMSQNVLGSLLFASQTCDSANTSIHPFNADDHFYAVLLLMAQ